MNQCKNLLQQSQKSWDDCTFTTNEEAKLKLLDFIRKEFAPFVYEDRIQPVSYFIRTYAKLVFMPKLTGYSPRRRNELRYYEPKTSQKRVNCVSPIYTRWGYRWRISGSIIGSTIENYCCSRRKNGSIKS